jgi:hypothetical protein
MLAETTSGDKAKIKTAKAPATLLPIRRVDK